jgi:cytochrome c-type biogenesis protein CcmH/NrfF
MSATPSVDAGGRLKLRQMVLWGAFLALLIIGVVLWFRFSGRIVPMLDALTDR